MNFLRTRCLTRPLQRSLSVCRLNTALRSVVCIGLLAALQHSAVLAQPVMRSVPLAMQLAEDGALSAATRRPVILFFTLPDCSYCRIVRHDYLLPLLRAQRENEQPLIREVSVTGTRLLTGFDGQRISEAELARRYQVAMTPTLLLVNAQGELLVGPLLGGDHPQYRSLLNTLIAEASQKITGQRVRVRGSDHRE